MLNLFISRFGASQSRYRIFRLSIAASALLITPTGAAFGVAKAETSGDAGGLRPLVRSQVLSK